jgi:hypothetical protein
MLVPRMDLPPCGLYATLAPIGTVPANRLVYFHNHGNPGPGVYLPASWIGNRAQFEARGHLLASPSDASQLDPLPPEGLYRVIEPFFCCPKRCRRYEAEALVQLGYDASARAILFVPELVGAHVALPTRGTRVDRENLVHVQRLKVHVADAPRHEGGSDETLLH